MLLGSIPCSPESAGPRAKATGQQHSGHPRHVFSEPRGADPQRHRERSWAGTRASSTPTPQVSTCRGPREPEVPDPTDAGPECTQPGADRPKRPGRGALTSGGGW